MAGKPRMCGRMHSVVLAAVAIALAAFLYRDFLGWLRWNVSVGTIESHCGLVPLLALGLAWLRRDELAAAGRLRETWADSERAGAVGLTLAVWAAALQLLATAADSLAASGLSLVFMMHALALALGGWARTRVLLPCIYFLLFMLPVRYPLEVFLGFPLRLVSTQAAEWAIGACGLPVLRSGTVLTMPGITLQIGSPCSGLNVLTGVLMLAAFHAILTRAALVEGVTLVAAAVPAALAANTLRIAVLGIVGTVFGSEAALGAVHEYSGLGTFALAMGLVWLLSAGLQRVRAPRAARSEVPAAGGQPLAWSRTGGRLATLLLIAATADWMVGRIPRAGLDLPDTATFPRVVAAAPSADEPLTDDERELIAATGGQIARRAYEVDGRTVWMALVTAGSSWRIHHPPEFCYLAQGWTVLQNDVITRKGGPGYRELLTDRDGERRLVQYWFTDGSRATTNLLERWFHGLATAFRGRSARPWLMVTLSARERDAEALDALRVQIQVAADEWIAGRGTAP